MNDRSSPGIGRRDLLRVLTLSAAAATSSACVPLAATESEADLRAHKPRYRETADVKNFYRVNSYPP